LYLTDNLFLILDIYVVKCICECFDAVGWVTGRASGM